MSSNVLQLSTDIDMENDFKSIQTILVRNYRELRTYERWSTEVTSGHLKWGILHTEKFWKENARFVESDNFAMLKALISLLDSIDPVVVCIALYDIGEFARFYPNGRVVVSKLGGKDAAMKILNKTEDSDLVMTTNEANPDNVDGDLQKHSLACISKIMVTNWEFMK